MLIKCYLPHRSSFPCSLSHMCISHLCHLSSSPCLLLPPLPSHFLWEIYCFPLLFSCVINRTVSIFKKPWESYRCHVIISVACTVVPNNRTIDIEVCFSWKVSSIENDFLNFKNKKPLSLDPKIMGGILSYLMINACVPTQLILAN